MKKFSIYPAELNKEILNDSKLGGEIKVYNELKKNNLPGFSVFYSCWWHNETAKEIKDSKDGETDFILAHPNHGILFIEVKGVQVLSDITNLLFVPKVASADAIFTLVRKEIIISGFWYLKIFLNCNNFHIRFKNLFP